jgi:hypothetical protein
MLRTKMSDGRTDGQTDGDYFYIPRRLSARDNKSPRVKIDPALGAIDFFLNMYIVKLKKI